VHPVVSEPRYPGPGILAQVSGHVRS